MHARHAPSGVQARATCDAVLTILPRLRMVDIVCFPGRYSRVWVGKFPAQFLLRVAPALARDERPGRDGGERERLAFPGLFDGDFVEVGGYRFQLPLQISAV